MLAKPTWSLRHSLETANGRISRNRQRRTTLKAKRSGLIIGIILLLFFPFQSIHGYDLSLSVIDGGGGESQDGSYTLISAIGQTDMGTMSSSSYSWQGGLWAILYASEKGQCGTADGDTFNTQPTTNLCSIGTASAVSGTGPWSWTCYGLNGGTNASCSADITTFIVSPSAGSHGSINPNTDQTIKDNATITFTITPDPGYTASVGGTCGGTLVGTTYTTNAITAACTVIANFIDTTSPSLSITSHSNGQHVSTSSITLMGTASDGGKGDNGIQQVTVNGVRANNDTATGSGTANWSKAITLNPGTNTITVLAYDNSSNHNSTTASLTIYYDAVQAPSVTTGPATNVTQHTAQLNGTINPNGLLTTYYFEWGLTTGYGNKSPATPASAGDGFENVAVSTNLTGLTPYANYHYRLVATNSNGTTYGADMSFIANVKAIPWLMFLLD